MPLLPDRPRILKTPAFILAVALTIGVHASANTGRTYFEENFQNYRYRPANVNPDLAGIEAGNDPVWSQTAEVNVNLEQDGLVFRDYRPSAKVATALKSYDVLFHFRLRPDPASKTPGALELRLRNLVNGTPGEIALKIDSGSISISGTGPLASVKHNAALPFPILIEHWHTCVVTVRDGKATVLIDRQRTLEPVATFQLPAGAVADGINFFGRKNLPFSVSEIVVRAPGPLPDRRISRLLPTQPTIKEADFRVGATATVPANDRFGATIRTGSGDSAVKMTLRLANGEEREVTFTTNPVKADRLVIAEGKQTKEQHEWPDGIIAVAGLDNPRQPLLFHVRPMHRRYHTSYSYTQVYHDLTRDWDQLPPASRHPLRVEARKTDGGVDIYLDGSLAKSLKEGPVKEVSFSASGSAAIGATFSEALPHDRSRYQTMDLASQRMARTLVGATSSLGSNLQTIKGIPIEVAAPDVSADIGLVREGQGNWALEVDEYLGRSPFDGLLTEVHFTIPGGALYSRAWVLCAVDPDPAKDPILTTRITRYLTHGIGGNRLADTTLTLPRPGEPLGKGIIEVGKIQRTGKDGKPQTLPVYLVEVSLDSGKIVDQLMESEPLNLDFYGKPWENFEQLDNSIKPDPRSVSAVQVLGVTLEKSPVGVKMVQHQPSNIFHNDEKPETSMVLHSAAPAKGALHWSIEDHTGQTIKEGTYDLAFAKAGEERKITIPLATPDLGWFRFEVTYRDASDKAGWSHRGSFARLGKDERKAGYESPYGTWWFDGAHLTPEELDFAGPTMFKAGIRRASWTKLTEAEMSKWKITKAQLNTPFEFSDLAKDDENWEKAAEKLRKAIADYPSVREIAVFHESGPGNDLPVELFGQKPSLTPFQAQNEKRYADLMNRSGAYFREKFPGYKLVVGNNSASQSVLAAILRHGGNPDYIDYIGIEAPSQVIIPEKLQEWALQGMHVAMDTTEAIAGRRIPASGCFEFTYRSERDMGQHQQAQWYVRDILISLANRFTLIAPGILYDTANSYHNGLWGASGLLERAPYGYPKQSYVAYSVVTNVFDQIGDRRMVPTGSATVYALEGTRADGKKAIALWAARGEAEFQLNFAGEANLRVVDFYGKSRNEKTSGKQIKVTAGATPLYLLSDKSLEGISLGERRFPADLAIAEKALPESIRLDSLEAAALDYDNGLETPMNRRLQTPVRKVGAFELRAVKDEERGDCLELELKKPEPLSKYYTEYVTVRLKEPVALSGTPAALGAWVKGNSNWGRVMFEIEDADGEVWQSVGTGGWGCDILDWPGHLSVNFDGWNFVSLPLRDTQLYPDHSPGPVSEQWVSSGGDKKIAYPVKVRALIIEMHREALAIKEFTTPEATIRLHEIVGIQD